jgi:hypothetical protein
MRYFDLIITLHAQEQIEERGLRLEEVWETFKHYTRFALGKRGGTEFVKEFPNYTIKVEAFQNRKNEWVVKTAWRNPAIAGTKDAKNKSYWKKLNKAGFWGKIWLTITRQLGLE